MFLVWVGSIDGIQRLRIQSAVYLEVTLKARGYSLWSDKPETAVQDKHSECSAYEVNSPIQHCGTTAGYEQLVKLIGYGV